MATNALGRETSVIKAEADYVEAYPGSGSGSGSSLSPADEAIDRMSPEERAAEVRLGYHRYYTTDNCGDESSRLTNDGMTIGEKAAPQTRPQTDSLALSTLLDVLPRSHEHRQCEAQWTAYRFAHDWRTI